MRSAPRTSPRGSAWRPPASRCRSRRRADEVRDPAREQNPILVGRDNALVEDLVKIGKARLDDLAAGEGVVQIVPRAFGNVTATVVAGADAAGTEAASATWRGACPTCGTTARGALSLDDVETERRTVPRRAKRRGAGVAGARRARRDCSTNGPARAGRSRIGRRRSCFSRPGDPGSMPFLDRRSIRPRRQGAAKVTVKSRRSPTPTRSSTRRSTSRGRWTSSGRGSAARCCRRSRRGARRSRSKRGSASRPRYRSTIADQVRAELTKAGAAEPERPHAVGLQAGVPVAHRAGHPGAEGQGRPRRFTSRSRSTSPTCRRSTSSTRCRAAGCTSSIRSTTSSQRELGIAKDRFSLELVDAARRTSTRVEALDASGRVVARGDVQPEVRRARVPGQVSRLVARRGDDGLDDGHGQRTDGRRRAHRRPIPSASGIDYQARSCRASTTT